MARKKRARRRLDWRVVVFAILSLMIAISMILAYFPLPSS